MGSIDVFSINSVELNVSVMVLSAGVAADDEAIIKAGNVSILEERSVSVVNWGPVEVKMFSGAGMVSVWNRGLDEEGLIVGSMVLVNVL